MSSTRMSRTELVEAIGWECRRNSTRTVLFHTAIADHLGLNPSDHKCADLLLAESGVSTPGRLAELTGLSSGAITGVLDRLERAGFIAREADPDDRRRIFVKLTPQLMPNLQRLFAPLVQGMARGCEQSTAAELQLILHLRRATDVM